MNIPSPNDEGQISMGHAANGAALLRQAWRLFELRREEQALSCAADALAAGADLAEASSLSALCLANLERYSEAVVAARTALREAPDQALGHHAMGYACYQEARNNRPATFASYDGSTHELARREARNAYEEAIRLAPNDPLYHEMMGFVLYEYCEYGGAEQAIRRSLELNPDNPSALTLWSDICRATRRHSEAHRYALAALAVSAENASGHAALGWAKLMHGDAKASVDLFQESLRLDPSDDYAREGLVEALKVQHVVIRLPYRLTDRLRGLDDVLLLQHFPIIATVASMLLGALVGFLVTGDPGGSLAGLMVGLLLGFTVPLLILMAPSMLSLLLAMFNLVLLAHPLGKHALTPWQRYRAVALLGYLLPVFLAGVGLLVARFVFDWPGANDTLVRWVVAVWVLVGPLAAWAATMTTRWVKPAGIIAALFAVGAILAIVDLHVLEPIMDVLWPDLLLLVGLCWGLFLPSRL